MVDIGNFTYDVLFQVFCKLFTFVHRSRAVKRALPGTAAPAHAVRGDSLRQKERGAWLRSNRASLRRGAGGPRRGKKHVLKSKTK